MLKLGKYYIDQTDEFVLQDANKPFANLPASSGLLKPAPEPLLPNFGEGRIRQYNLDLHLMVVLNGMERRLHDFIRLGNEAGLQFERVWDFGDMGAVEYRLSKNRVDVGVKL